MSFKWVKNEFSVEGHFELREGSYWPLDCVFVWTLFASASLHCRFLEWCFFRLSIKSFKLKKKKFKVLSSLLDSISVVWCLIYLLYHHTMRDIKNTANQRPYVKDEKADKRNDKKYNELRWIKKNNSTGTRVELGTLHW